MSVWDSYLVPSTDPILKRICEPVPPGADLGAICGRMEGVCKRGTTKGVGLAAPQIGHAIRLIYICSGEGKGQFMVNPEITAEAPHKMLMEEACLSYPGKRKVIARPGWVSVKYETLKRSPMARTFYGFHARVVCHEVDHLNGICRVGDDSPSDSPAVAADIRGRSKPRCADAAGF